MKTSTLIVIRDTSTHLVKQACCLAVHRDYRVLASVSDLLRVTLAQVDPESDEAIALRALLRDAEALRGMAA